MTHSNLTPKEFAKLISLEFHSTRYPDSTKIVFKDGGTLHGYFQTCNDSSELEKNLKFRFVPWIQAQKFREDFTKNRINNPDHTVIVDCNRLLSVELEVGALA